ncbi:MAG: response regulator [Thermodesulfobacteriota bacterium]
MYSIKHSLTKQQATRIFVVAAVIFFILSFFELNLAIKQKRTFLTSLQDQIVNLASKGAGQALWSLDASQGTMHLDAILNINVVQQVDILELNGTTFISRKKQKKVATPFEQRIGQWLFANMLVSRQPLYVSLKKTGGVSREKNIGTISVTMDPVPLTRQFIRDVLIKIIGEALRALLLAIIFSIVLHRFLTRPLASLGNQINISETKSPEENLLTVPTGHENDEIGIIVQQFNQKHRDMEQAIEKLQQSEKSMRESEERYRGVVEDLPALVCSFLQDGTIMFANRAYCNYFGRQPEEMLGVSFLTLIPETEREKVMTPILALTPEAPCMNHEHQVIAADGTVRWQRWVDRALFDDAGKPVIYQAIGEDITDRKLTEERQEKLEKQLQQAHKMEAIGTLAGGIAHDFNNILGAILGFTDMAKDDVPRGSALYNNLEQVLVAGNRAKDLVAQILAFSRQDKHAQQPLQPQPIIKEITKFLRSSIPASISIDLDIDEKCGMIKADPTQLHQVVMNLCTNAYQAMEKDGGTLSIGLNRAELTADDLRDEPSLRPGPYVLLAVGDTGPGIEPASLKYIFDPFYTTKEVGKGTGMGLAVVHGIMKNHGGMIRLQTTTGQGTDFHLYFPELLKISEKDSVTEQLIPTGDEQILFVDDETLLVDLGKQLLERLGYSVTALTDSLEALEVFKAQPDRFDLIITDLAMPNMSGTELAREILALREDIPVILCTGYSSIISKDEAFAMGIDEFVMKPVVKKDIAPLIRKVLNRKRLTQGHSDKSPKT